MNIFKKKNKIYSFLFGCILVGFTACAEVDFGSFIPKDPNLTFGESDTIIVGKGAADYQVIVTSNLPWRVKADADWISFKRQSGLQSDTVIFTVAKNTTTVARMAKLTAWITLDKENVIIIKQEAGDPLPDTSLDYYVKTTGTVNNDGLSWDKPTTLDKTLSLAGPKDRIHIAAGTYIPTALITGGSAADVGDKTFEIKSNTTIIGGYAADASIGAIADATVNQTILSGNLGSSKVYHVVSITAPKEDNRKVTLSGLTIKEGQASTLTTKVSLNGAAFPRNYGGGVIIGKSNVEFNNCSISNNSSLAHSAGLYVFSQSEVIFNNCSIKNNIGTSSSSNGGGIWNDASTIYYNNSTISDNQVGGVGAGIYAYNATLPSINYFFNSTISNNKTGIAGVARAASGYYGRENSIGLMVNCTVYGNTADLDGAGISIYGSGKLDIISSTITNNNSGKTGGGIKVNTGATLNLYNSIVSGNISVSGEMDVDGIYTKSYSVVTNNVFNQNGVEVPVTIFDAATMLGALTNNGGQTMTCLLLGENNPAVTLGMSSTQLSTLAIGFDPAILESIITFDQLGKSRAGKTAIGACVK